MIKVFFSYSHHDEAVRKELEVHLSTLTRQGIVSTWHDRRIEAGAKFVESIDENLEDADVILLLISPHFLNSDYCYEIEMKRALERHEANEAHVIPIILELCDWQNAPFASLLALPPDGRPISQYENRNEAFQEIVKELRAIAEKSDQRSSDVQLLKNEDIEAWLELLPPEYKELGHSFVNTFCKDYFVSKKDFTDYCNKLVTDIHNESPSRILLAVHNSSHGSFVTEEKFRELLMATDELTIGVSKLQNITSRDLVENTVVIVDDFAWSGDTALQAIKIFSNICDDTTIGDSRIIFAFIVAHRTALQTIESALNSQRIEGKVIAGLTLKEEQTLLDSPQWTQYEPIINCMIRLHKQYSGDKVDFRSLCPIVFHYGPPDCALPLFGGIKHSRTLFQVLMHRPLHFLPSVPLFSNRDTEINILHQAIDGHTKHITVTGESGVGKTYLVAKVVSSLDAKDKFIFWHSFRSVASVQHFVDNFNVFLKSIHLEKDAQQLRVLSLESWTLVQFIQKLSSKLLIVLDHVDELDVNSEATLMVNELMKYSPSDSPLIIVIGNRTMLEVQDKNVQEMQITRFNEEESRVLVKQFLGNKYQQLKDDEVNILKLGQKNHTTMLLLATSLSLALIVDDKDNDKSLDTINDEVDATTGSSFAFLLSQLWKRLPPDVSIYVAVASTLIEPCYTEAIRVIFRRLTGSYPDMRSIRDYLKQISNPFFRYAGNNRTELLQFSTCMRRMIQEHLPQEAGKFGLKNYEEELYLPNGYSYESLHAACAWFYSDYIPKNHLWDFIPETEQVVLSHYHSIYSGSTWIIEKLREVKVLVSQGMNIAKACHYVGLTEQTYYCWVRGIAAFAQISRNI